MSMYRTTNKLLLDFLVQQSLVNPREQWGLFTCIGFTRGRVTRHLHENNLTQNYSVYRVRLCSKQIYLLQVRPQLLGLTHLGNSKEANHTMAYMTSLGKYSLDTELVPSCPDAIASSSTLWSYLVIGVYDKYPKPNRPSSQTPRGICLRRGYEVDGCRPAQNQDLQST